MVRDVVLVKQAAGAAPPAVAEPGTYIVKPGDIFIVGKTFEELGGSHYYGLRRFVGNRVPKVDAVAGKGLMDALADPAPHTRMGMST